MNEIRKKLDHIRSSAGARMTEGLTEAQLEPFMRRDPRLEAAISDAYEQLSREREAARDLIDLPEEAQITEAQRGLLNFYPSDSVSPYVALAANGPWVISLKGAVIYDCGGYGMLGLGHSPPGVMAAMSRASCMANAMTPSLSQHRFLAAMRSEIGHRRDGCPYDSFVCLNSGSEALGLAALIADTHARTVLDTDPAYRGARVVGMALEGSFHGRTHRAAMYSHSTRPVYRGSLASFRDYDDALVVVPPNDVGALERAFESARASGAFVEALFLEPVLGEGHPGLALTPEFYGAARDLTRDHGTLLVVDSVQAAFRAHGVMSVCDYPGFESLDPPDLEAFSKALNGGQYPLSVLAFRPDAAEIYRTGTYGNTMTANPRALDVAVAVIEGMNESIRRNIVERGGELLAGFRRLKDEPGESGVENGILEIRGCGLLVSLSLDPDRLTVVGRDSVEDLMRRRGVNVIHGGRNSLRFTPHFGMSAAEVELVIEVTRDALAEAIAAA